MPQLEKGVVKARAARLRAAGQDALIRHLQTHIGEETAVLIERGNLGRLADFTPVEIETKRSEAGRPVRARIIGHDQTKLRALAI